MDTWREIPEFPGYSVSDYGQVRNDMSEHILAQTVVPRGVYVTMSFERFHFNRMVSRLVAEAFLPSPDPYDPEIFNTPINLDGDRRNNRIENLAWRPRWFAGKYHAQFRRDWTDGPKIMEVVTGDRFTSVLEAAMAHGLLAHEVFLEAMNHGVYGFDDYGVWPYYKHFVVVHNKARSNRRI